MYGPPVLGETKRDVTETDRGFWFVSKWTALCWFKVDTGITHSGPISIIDP